MEADARQALQARERIGYPLVLAGTFARQQGLTMAGRGLPGSQERILARANNIPDIGVPCRYIVHRLFDRNLTIG